MLPVLHNLVVEVDCIENAFPVVLHRRVNVQVAHSLSENLDGAWLLDDIKLNLVVGRSVGARVDSFDVLSIHVDLAVVQDVAELQSSLLASRQLGLVVDEALVLLEVLEIHRSFAGAGDAWLVEDSGYALHLERIDGHRKNHFGNRFPRKSGVFVDDIAILLEEIARSSLLGNWSAVVIAGQQGADAVLPGGEPEVGAAVHHVQRKA